MSSDAALRSLLPHLDHLDVDDERKLDLIQALAELLRPLVDEAFGEDGFGHMKLAEMSENTAVSGDSVVEYSVHEQSKNTPRDAFARAGSNE